jgi:anti-sigma factor RsiW
VIGLLTEYLEGGLAGATLAALEAHLAGCGACAQYFESLRTTRAAVARLRCDALPEEVHTRLRAFLRLRAASSR